MFKIKDTKTGLYSSGGYHPTWTKRGKLYHTMVEVVASLSLYMRGYPVRGLEFRTKKAIELETKRRRRTIPSSWAIVEFRLTPIKTTVATKVR